MPGGGRRGGGPNQTLEAAGLNRKTGDTTQNINITDIICEGPIKGLVGGQSGVFLDNVAVEDAKFTQQIPVQTSTSGSITFSGTAQGTVDSNTTLDTSLTNSSVVVPRTVFLIDYLETNVSISKQLSRRNYDRFTVTAVSGTPFSSAWNTTEDDTLTAAIHKVGHIVQGNFNVSSNSTTTGFLKMPKGSGLTNGTYTLRITKSIALSSIDSTSQLTVASTPTSGTYQFAISRQTTANDAGNLPANFASISNRHLNLNVQFRAGTLYQEPFLEVGGVGGSIAITGSTSGINLPEIKLIDSATATAAGVTRIDVAGMPDGSTDFNSAATILDSADFGLDTSAKIEEADEISWTIRYPTFETINLNKGKKETAYAFYIMQIRVKQDNAFGPWKNAFPDEGNYVRHQGKTNAPTSFEHVLNVEQFKPYDDFQVRIIRVTRHIGLPVTDDGTADGRTDKDKWSLQAKASIVSLGAVIKDRFSYPYTAAASVSFSSKEYDNTPSRSYLVEGKLVKVPDSYTPREYTADGVAKYEGFWDGTFRSELMYTDNPAWVFYDIVTNNRYGAGRWIKETDIDKFALYRIARYCDELVDDGNGGTEPRFRANVFLTKATDVYKVLKDFATIFLGILHWQDSKLTPIQDAPSDPIYTFTKGNVIDGKFSYETTGARTRVNQVVVTYNDPTVNFEPIPVIVEDRENIARTGKVITQNAVAFGATSEGQALRYGRWKLWTAQNQTEVINFKTSLASLFVQAGDIINVQDADRFGVQYSGRISKLSSPEDGLTLSVSLPPGDMADTDAAGAGTTKRSQDIVLGGELTLPSSFSQDAMIWEHGGTGTGSYLGIKQISGEYNLLFRASDGSTSVFSSTNNNVYAAVPISKIPQFDGGVHTLVWEIQVDVGRIRLWIDNILYIDERTSDNSNLESGLWSGGDPGGWGSTTSGTPSTESNNAWPVAPTKNLRIYNNQTVSGTWNDAFTKVTFDRNVSFTAGSSYELSTFVNSHAAFYVGEDALTIGSTTYNKGDRIPQAYVDADENGTYSLVDLDTESRASNAYSTASGTKALSIVWKPYSYIQKHAITNPGSSTNTVTLANSATFDKVPAPSTIWALTETNNSANVAGSAKKYKVLSISQDDSNIFGISAVEYFDEKYAAVDDEYELGVVPTTIYIEREPPTIPAPKNLRAKIDESADNAGKGLTVEWDAPDDFEFLAGYEVLHSIPNMDNPLRLEKTSVDIDKVPQGKTTFKVRVVSQGGNYSAYDALSFGADEYDENVPRMPGGIPKGALATAMLVNESNTLQFQANSYQIASIADPFNPVTSTDTHDISNLSNGDERFVHFDASVPLIRIVEYNSTALSGIPFYRSVGTGNYALSNTFSSIGTVTIAADSSTMSGSGFTTSLTRDTILSLGTNNPSGSDGAKVISVVSDTEARLDRSFDTAKSAITAYKQNLEIDYSADAIIARVTKSSDTVSLEKFITVVQEFDNSTLEITDDGTIRVSANGITGTEIAANAIYAGAIQDGAVIEGAVAANAIIAGAVAANAITAGTLSVNAVVLGAIAANAIQSTELVANAVTASELAQQAVAIDNLTDSLRTTVSSTAASVDSLSSALGSASAAASAANSASIQAAAASTFAVAASAARVAAESAEDSASVARAAASGHATAASAFAASASSDAASVSADLVSVSGLAATVSSNLLTVSSYVSSASSSVTSASVFAASASGFAAAASAAKAAASSSQTASQSSANTASSQAASAANSSSASQASATSASASAAASESSATISAAAKSSQLILVAAAGPTRFLAEENNSWGVNVQNSGELDPNDKRFIDKTAAPASYFTDSDAVYGNAYIYSGEGTNENVGPRRVYDFDDSRVYYVEIEYRVTSEGDGSASHLQSTYIGWNGYANNGNYQWTNDQPFNRLTNTSGSSTQILSGFFAGNDYTEGQLNVLPTVVSKGNNESNRSHTKGVDVDSYSSTVTAVGFHLRQNAGNQSNGRIAVKSFSVFDYTDVILSEISSQSAANSASAALSSFQAAAASKSSASAFATAASGHAASASTDASSASDSSSSALVSRNSASASEAQAASSATTAVTARDNSQSAADASANSASAALSSFQAADASRSSASAFASTASGHAASASTDAASASDSSSSALVSRNSASSNAAEAASSATTSVNARNESQSARDAASAARVAAETAAIILQVPTLIEPADQWTHGSQSTSSTIQKTTVDGQNKGSFTTSDSSFGAAWQFSVGDNITIGHAYPFDWDLDQVLEIKAKFRVINDGNDTVSGSKVRLGVTTQSSTALVQENMQTVGSVFTVADGEVERTAWFYYTGSGGPDVPGTLPSGVEAVALSGASTNLIYSQFRQNFTGGSPSGNSNGKTSLGSLRVRNVTQVAKALKEAEDAATSASAANSSFQAAQASASSASAFAATASGHASSASTDASSAANSSSSALVSRNTASSAAAEAASSSTTSVTARNDSQSAATASQSAATASQSAATSAAASRSSASSFASTASSYAASASTDAASASTSSSSAQTARDSASSSAASASSSVTTTVTARDNAQSAANAASASQAAALLEANAIGESLFVTPSSWATGFESSNLISSDNRFIVNGKAAPASSFTTSDSVFGNAYIFSGPINETVGPRRSFTYDPDTVYMIRIVFRVTSIGDDNGGDHINAKVGANGYTSSGAIISANPDISNLQLFTLADLTVAQGTQTFVGFIAGSNYDESDIDVLPFVQRLATEPNEARVIPAGGSGGTPTALTFQIRQNTSGSVGTHNGNGRLAIKSFEVIEVTDAIQASMESASAAVAAQASQSARQTASAFATSASSFATAASSSQATASANATSAEQSSSAAITARDAASASEAQAASSATTSATARDNSQSAAGASANSASAALSSSQAAAASRSSASAFASAASSSQATASTQAANAFNSASSALVSRNTASSAAAGAASSQTLAVEASDQALLVSQGISNAGFEFGPVGIDTTPAGWEAAGQRSDFPNDMQFFDTVDPNTNSRFGSKKSYGGGDNAQSGHWIRLSKYFSAAPSQIFHTNLDVFIEGTTANSNNRDAAWIDEDDVFVIYRWYDANGALLSQSAVSSATSQYNQDNTGWVSGVSKAPQQTWYTYSSRSATAVANTEYVRVDLILIDDQPGNIGDDSLVDYATWAAGGNFRGKIDDFELKSSNGDIVELNKGNLSVAENAQSASAAAAASLSSSQAAAASKSSASAFATAASSSKASASAAQTAAESARDEAVSARQTASVASAAAVAASAATVTARTGAEDAQSAAEAARDAALDTNAVLGNVYFQASERSAWSRNMQSYNLQSGTNLISDSSIPSADYFTTSDADFGNAYIFFNTDANETIGPRRVFPWNNDTVYFVRVTYRVSVNSTDGNENTFLGYNGWTDAGTNPSSNPDYDNQQPFSHTSRSAGTAGALTIAGFIAGSNYVQSELTSLDIVTNNKDCNQDGAALAPDVNTDSNNIVTSIGFQLRQNAGGDPGGRLAVKSFEVFDVTAAIDAALEAVDAGSSASAAQGHAQSASAFSSSAFRSASASETSYQNASVAQAAAIQAKDDAVQAKETASSRAASASSSQVQAASARASASAFATSASADAASASSDAASASADATSASSSASAAEAARDGIVLMNYVADSDLSASGSLLQDDNYNPSNLGTAGWNRTYLERSQSAAQIGTSSAKLKSAAYNDQFAELYNTNQRMVNGEKWTLGAWVYKNFSGNVTLQFQQAGGWATATATSTNAWQFVYGQGTSVSAATSLTVDIRGHNSQSSNASAEVFIDGLTVVRGHHDLSVMNADDSAATAAITTTVNANAAGTSASSAAASASAAGASASASESAALSADASRSSASAASTSAANSASAANTSASEANASAASAQNSASAANSSRLAASASFASASASAADSESARQTASVRAAAANESASTAAASASAAGASASAANSSRLAAFASEGSASSSASTAIVERQSASAFASAAASSAEAAAIDQTLIQARVLSGLNGHYVDSDWFLESIDGSGAPARVVSLNDGANIYAEDMSSNSVYTIIENAVSYSSYNIPSQTSQSGVGPWRIFSSGQIICKHADGFFGVPANFSSTLLANSSNRYNPVDCYIFAPFGEAQVEVYADANFAASFIEDTSTVDQTFNIPAGGYYHWQSDVDVSLNTANMTFVFKSTSPICGVWHPAGGDYMLLVPMTNQQIVSNNQTGAFIRFNQGTETSNSMSTLGSLSVARVYQVESDHTFAVTMGTADGAGGDAEFGLPRPALSDLYVWPEPDIANYRIATVEPNNITVMKKDGTVLYRHDLTAATVTAPGAHEQGNSNGNNNFDTGGGPYRFVGTAPFHIVAQDAGDQDETVLLGALQSKLDQSNTVRAIAQQTNTIQSTVDGNTTSVSAATTSINGLEAQYTVKINNNNVVSGFGLASENVNGNIVSAFVVQADSFAIMDSRTTVSSVPSATDIPFEVTGGVTKIKAANVGSLSAGNIAANAITSNQIAANSITATEITANTVTATGLTAATIFNFNPVSTTGSVRGWGGVAQSGGSDSGTYVSYDSTENALKFSNNVGGSGTQNRLSITGDSIQVDHNKIYRLKVSVKASVANGIFYVGSRSRNAYFNGSVTTGGQGSNVNEERYNTARDLIDTDTNQYFVNGPSLTTSYQDYTLYYIGANRSLDDVPNYETSNLSGLSPYIKLANADDKIYWSPRFLLWNQGTTNNDMFLKNLSITEVGTGQIVADNIVANTITATQIAANAVTATRIIANAITATRIAANAVTATQVQANAITATRIASNTITATQIAANAIVATRIAANAITARELEISATSASVQNSIHFTASAISIYGTAGKLRVLIGKLS